MATIYSFQRNMKPLDPNFLCVSYGLTPSFKSWIKMKPVAVARVDSATTYASLLQRTYVKQPYKSRNFHNLKTSTEEKHDILYRIIQNLASGWRGLTRYRFSRWLKKFRVNVLLRLLLLLGCDLLTDVFACICLWLLHVLKDLGILAPSWKPNSCPSFIHDHKICIQYYCYLTSF